MLTYLQVTLNNNPMRGGIEINSTTLKSNIGSVNKVKILRKNIDEIAWNTIKEIPITASSDLTFSYLDITVASRNTYRYSIDVMNSSTLIESQILNDVDCWFEGCFVGNFNKQYITGTNFEVESSIQGEIAYVTTLGSRTPYRVSNALTSYSTGSCSGHFFELTGDGKRIVPDDNYKHTNAVANFLTDGTGKILKTTDGQMWYVSIDSGVSKPFNDNYTGMNSIEFNWTEIGDVPVIGLAVG